MEEVADPDSLSFPPEEELCFLRTSNAFKSYKPYMINQIKRRIATVKKLNEDHRRYLKKYVEHLENLKVFVSVNNELLGEIAENIDIFENHKFESQSNGAGKTATPTSMDMDKVSSTLRQLAREWSTDGEEERSRCFQPLLERAEKLFPTNRQRRSVLVPGAGLGRLAYEFAVRGFACQGNEFSVHMLSASSYILNKCEEVNQYKIYPYVSHFSNNIRDADQIRAVSIPDVLPQSCSRDGSPLQFSMTAGDFTEVYAKQDEQWDVVATCFFIDTARNIVEYIELIHRILKPGGVWLNLGPLLYHHDGNPSVESIEPSFEDVKNIAKAVGFAIAEEEYDRKTHYCRTPSSMLEYVYNCALLVCEKKSSSSLASDSPEQLEARANPSNCALPSQSADLSHMEQRK